MKHKILFKGMRSFGLGLGATLAFTANVAQARLNPPDPKPKNKPTQEDLLGRYRGQTEFLNIRQFSASGARAQSGLAGGGGPELPRQEQESDVFKIGEPNSKLLYLLNNYRGLQIVSFKNGLEKPELTGRVESTGNWSEDMYFDAANKRIYVLERAYNVTSTNYGTTSRLVIYDVADATKPKLLQDKIVTIPGDIADHRIVGNVLYVATSEMKQFGGFIGANGTSEQAKGNIFSYRLGADEVKQIDHLELSKPVSHRQNMSIHTVKNADGTYKYYLAAVLSQSKWGWSDQHSYVELVDITDPNGKIQPIFIATPRGTIAKRSQIQIKNDTLVVVSNYAPPVKNAVLRIAVETFNIPTKGKVKTIDTNEAEYRTHWIDYQAKKAGSEVERRENAYNEAVSDEKMGLRGVYVVSEQEGLLKGRLQKWAADTTLVTKDARNENTTIFDVRASEKFLYVFWFPGSKDPLEVFTFDTPETKIEHLVHKEFEGWISRSFPVQYKGREMLIGLGYRPIEGGQPWQRRPQAVLFDVVRSGELADAKIVATSELSQDANVWANFDGQDKFTEIRFETDFADSGKGYILFQLDSWGKGKSGGKLVGFDLSKSKKAPKEVFTSGAILSGNASWLRRVFTNPELLAINTFSNESLGTFKVDGKVGKESEVVTAVSVLELARNIRGFVTLGDKGFQIISQNNEGDTQAIVLRKVEASKPDAEKSEVLVDLKIAKGSLNDFYLKNQTLFVLSSTQRLEKKEEVGKPVSYNSFVDYSLAQVLLSEDKPKLVGTPLEWTEKHGDEGQVGPAGKFRPFYRSSSDAFLVLNKELLISTLSGLKKVIEGANLKTVKVDISACNVKDIAPQVIVVNGKLYSTYSEKVEHASIKEITYTKNYVAFAKLNGEKLECGGYTNIPGKIVGSGKNHIVTQDQRFLYMNVREFDGKKYYSPVTKPCLVSLQLKDTTSTLVDLFESENLGYQAPRVVKGSLLFVPVNYNQQFASGGRFELAELGFDSDLRFTSKVSEHKLPGNYWNLSDVLHQGNQTLLVLTNGSLTSVMEWQPGTGGKLLKVTAPGSKPAEYFRTQGYWSYYANEKNGKLVEWSASQKALNFSQGFFGLLQVQLP